MFDNKIIKISIGAIIKNQQCEDLFLIILRLKVCVNMQLKIAVTNKVFLDIYNTR